MGGEMRAGYAEKSISVDLLERALRDAGINLCGAVVGVDQTVAEFVRGTIRLIVERPTTETTKLSAATVDAIKEKFKAHGGIDVGFYPGWPA